MNPHSLLRMARVCVYKYGCFTRRRRSPCRLLQTQARLHRLPIPTHHCLQVPTELNSPRALGCSAHPSSSVLCYFLEIGKIAESLFFGHCLRDFQEGHHESIMEPKSFNPPKGPRRKSTYHHDEQGASAAMLPTPNMHSGPQHSIGGQLQHEYDTSDLLDVNNPLYPSIGLGPGLHTYHLGVDSVASVPYYTNRTFQGPGVSTMQDYFTQFGYYARNPNSYRPCSYGVCEKPTTPRTNRALPIRAPPSLEPSPGRSPPAGAPTEPAAMRSANRKPEKTASPKAAARCALPRATGLQPGSAGQKSPGRSAMPSTPKRSPARTSATYTQPTTPLQTFRPGTTTGSDSQTPSREQRAAETDSPPPTPSRQATTACPTMSNGSPSTVTATSTARQEMGNLSLTGGSPTTAKSLPPPGPPGQTSPPRPRPAPKWSRSSASFRQEYHLTRKDLEVGLLVYVPPNGEWWGDHPAIVRGWINTRAIWCTSATTCQGRSMEKKSNAAWEDWERKDLMRLYLLADSESAVSPHLDTPVLKFKGGKLPENKPSYVNFCLEFQCSIDDLLRYNDKTGLKNRYVIEDMAFFESYRMFARELEAKIEIKKEKREEEQRRLEKERAADPDRCKACRESFKAKVRALAEAQKAKQAAEQAQSNHQGQVEAEQSNGPLVSGDIKTEN